MHNYGEFLSLMANKIIRKTLKHKRLYFEVDNKKFKVLDAEMLLFHNSIELWNTKKAGEFFCENKQLMVKCKDGILILKNIQPESKIPMDGYAFWCGYQQKLKN